MKNILLLAVLALMVSGMAFGQNGEGTSAQAVVIVTIAGTDLLVTAEDGEWGPLAPGTTYTITADGNITPPQADGEFNVPQNPSWLIAASDAVGVGVSVTFALPPFFSGADASGGARLPYTALANSAGYFPGGSVEPGAAYIPMDPRVPNTVYLNGDGEALIGIGGVLSLPANMPGADVAEEYAGVFILTAAFTGF